MRSRLWLGAVALVLGMGGLSWFGWQSDDTESYGSERPRPLIDGKPNVVVVIGCTLRRDQLSPYGAPRFTTPFLGALAERGAVFDHGVSAAPWTRPASTALLTGYHAVQVGMVEPGTKLNRRRLPDAVVTLAERLGGDGYETIGLTANPNLNRVFGFHQGFDEYRENQGLWSDQDVLKVSSLQLATEALTLVETRQRPAAPLYLQLLTIDTHEPIHAPPRRARQLARDGVPPRIGAYRFEVQRWDEGLEELWQGLSRRGYDESNTILVVVSDHGEGLSYPPEHGVGHGNFLLPSTIDMPWIMHGYGIAEGHRIAGVASQVDVHPTIASLVGVDGYDGPGRDWAEQVRGASDRTNRAVAYADTYYQRANRAAAYAENRLCQHDFLDLAEHLGLNRMLPKTACFDRLVDPGVRTPMEEPDEELVKALLAWRDEQRAAYEAWPHHHSVTRDDPVMKQLEELGYIDPE